jgi:hypothetical protein
MELGQGIIRKVFLDVTNKLNYLRENIGVNLERVKETTKKIKPLLLHLTEHIT